MCRHTHTHIHHLYTSIILTYTNHTSLKTHTHTHLIIKHKPGQGASSAVQSLFLKSRAGDALDKQNGGRQQTSCSLQLLLGADVGGVATLALAAVGGTRMQPSVAPASEQTMRDQKFSYRLDIDRKPEATLVKLHLSQHIL